MDATIGNTNMRDQWDTLVDESYEAVAAIAGHRIDRVVANPLRSRGDRIRARPARDLSLALLVALLAIAIGLIIT